MCLEKKRKPPTPKGETFSYRLTYINNRILGRVAALSFPFLFLLIPDGSPGAVSQVLDLLDIFTRLF